MDGLRLGDKLLNGPLCGPLFDTGNRLFYLDAVRKPLVRALDRRLVARTAHFSPLAPQQTLIARAVLHTLDRRTPLRSRTSSTLDDSSPSANHPPTEVQLDPKARMTRSCAWLFPFRAILNQNLDT